MKGRIYPPEKGLTVSDGEGGMEEEVIILGLNFLKQGNVIHLLEDILSPLSFSIFFFH